ncbi:hypothetical protein GNI_152720 [Gregarina niphandrodes]|uniref:Uncharacterized protein n=1 Tax=Gregarina niphandrodes TaxID=110365 RepID=A0A023AZG0_GRENI|nr:hypothetical protein GNI_152720 [Gregarina niphandrodes]EZG44075.1 hypothetical protein GNI_152720 [Gregarina niphandrodes]|eukprot:XP_011132818.1 hypothetical protein GNI_152720 [Gregarina niphandrodes]
MLGPLAARSERSSGPLAVALANCFQLAGESETVVRSVCDRALYYEAAIVREDLLPRNPFEDFRLVFGVPEEEVKPNRLSNSFWVAANGCMYQLVNVSETKRKKKAPDMSDPAVGELIQEIVCANLDKIGRRPSDVPVKLVMGLVEEILGRFLDDEGVKIWLRQYENKLEKDQAKLRKPGDRTPSCWTGKNQTETDLDGVSSMSDMPKIKHFVEMMMDNLRQLNENQAKRINGELKQIVHAAEQLTPPTEPVSPEKEVLLRRTFSRVRERRSRVLTRDNSRRSLSKNFLELSGLLPVAEQWDLHQAELHTRVREIKASRDGFDADAKELAGRIEDLEQRLASLGAHGETHQMLLEDGTLNRRRLKTELDRRLLNARKAALEREERAFEKQRELHRRRRDELLLKLELWTEDMADQLGTDPTELFRIQEVVPISPDKAICPASGSTTKTNRKWTWASWLTARLLQADAGRG